ncbi:hypothetical protein, partial [Legionella pneumophila]
SCSLCQYLNRQSIRLSSLHNPTANNFFHIHLGSFAIKQKNPIDSKKRLFTMGYEKHDSCY